MSVRVSLHLLAVGSCRHCERITIQGGGLSPVVFPSIAALILHPTQGPVLYDTGYAEHFFEATGTFPEKLYRWITPVNIPDEEKLHRQLSRYGVSLSDITFCLISHFHADHIAGLKNLPDAKFITMQSEYNHIISMGRFSGLRKAFLPGLLPDDFLSRLTFAENLKKVSLNTAWSALGEGYDLLGDGSLVAVRLPGHSPGQMGLLLNDEQGREVLLCADAVWSRKAFLEERYPSMIARLVTDDWYMYKNTVKQLHLISQAHPEICILPSHCKESLEQYGFSKC